MSGAYWAELRVFLAVAKAKSVNKAEAELHMSRGKISKNIMRLQDMMGCVLLISNNSGIQLTERGRELANKLVSLDQMLSVMSYDLRAETREAEGTVRITATEGLTGFFIVPNLFTFTEQYPKIHAHLHNPVNLLNFRENQCDVMVGFGPLAEPDLESKPAGFLNLIAVVGKTYIDHYGMPSRDNLHKHKFLDADYYASQTATYFPWRNAVNKGVDAHHCENPFAYGLMVKAGVGIGLLANYVLVDPDFVPVDLDIHVQLPIYIHAYSERLRSRPVRIVFDWLAEVFSSANPLFASDLKLDDCTRVAVSQSLDHISIGTPLARRRAHER